MKIPWKVRMAARAVYAADEVMVFHATPPLESPRTPSGSDAVVHVRDVPCVDVCAGRGDPWPAGLRALAAGQPPTAVAHVLSVDGKHASWGFSTIGLTSWPITETGTELLMPPASACLAAFETAPEFRGRKLYQRLLSHILTCRFEDGAAHAFIWCLTSNAPSRAAIERVGFRHAATHRRTTVLGRARTHIVDR
jgi:GNAT superfamily N-acetyltransferase